MSSKAESVDVENARPAPPKAADDINRIIIGLGGQGSRIVNEVRKEVLRHGPIASGIEFIAVDSDRQSLAALDSVPEDQRIYLAAPDDNITETVVPWLPHEFRPKAGGGCGMQRLTGKAMYLVHRHRILETVREVARRLRQRTHVSNFMVVLVNAFGGGTGSGMAIDFSLDVRADLKEVTGQEPLMFGIGIMPSRSETIQRANGVAILKELHFLLSHKEPIVVNGRDYSSPFELYFLVGREVMGIERDDDVLSNIVRFTIDLGLIPASRSDATAGKAAGWVDLQDIRTLVKGAGHMFSTFGCYRASFPGETLLEYFDALDKLAELRKELPSFTTNLEAEKQTLEDRKIAVAHAEEVLRIANARAAKLRMNGILGANRPELAKLLGDIGRLEDNLRKTRRQLGAAEGTLPGLAERREAVEKEVREWEHRAETLRQAIVRPAQSRSAYTVPLRDEEIEYLAKNREIVRDGGFRSVMAALGRTTEYHDKTMEVVGKNRILYLPLVNYRMAFHTASAFPPKILSALAKHGFIRYDAAGNPLVSNDHLWMVMAMLSTMPENIDADKVSARAFKEVVEGHVARRAEVKIVPSQSKRFEVLVHSWMVGVQVAPVAPGYPPRLRELEWLMPEYEQVMREGGLAQHHAFLYGDPAAFARLAALPVDRVSATRTHEMVTDFWAKYAPIEPAARWTQLPPLLAEAVVAADELAASASSLTAAADAFRGGETAPADLDRLLGSLAQGTEAVDAFRRRFVEDAQPLRERIRMLAEQLERTRTPPRDPSHLLQLDELAADALAAAETAEQAVTRLRAEVPQAIRRSVAEAHARQQAASGDRVARRALARWEHLAAQAAGHLARLEDVAAQTLTSLGELERLLQGVEQTVRAKALGSTGAGVAPPVKPIVAVDGDRRGNGHAHANGGKPQREDVRI